MRKKLDLVGKSFGKLTVLEFHTVDGDARSYFITLCECGKVQVRLGTSLTKTKNPVRSCGCFRPSLKTNHNMAHTRTYKCWSNLLANSRDVVSAKWLEFANFLSDMGEIPDGRVLKRLDNTKPYEASNCKWGTREEKRKLQVSYEGKVLSLIELAEAKSLPYMKLWARLNRGWTVEEAVMGSKT